MLKIETEVKEEVAQYFIRQMEQASPSKREKLVRLLIGRLPRYAIDGMWIVVQAMSSDKDDTEQG